MPELQNNIDLAQRHRDSEIALVPEWASSRRSAILERRVSAATLKSERDPRPTDVSDARLKENIQDLDGALALLAQLDGKSFNMIGSTATDFGFIAQNVQLVLPEAVSVVDPEKAYLGVSYLDFIPWLVEAVNELYAKVQEYFARTERLEERVSTLEAQLAASAAGATAGDGQLLEAPAASAHLESNADTDTTTTPAEATSTPDAANHNEPAADLASEEPTPEPAMDEPEPEPANDNGISEDLSATGTD